MQRRPKNFGPVLGQYCLQWMGCRLTAMLALALCYFTRLETSIIIKSPLKRGGVRSLLLFHRTCGQTDCDRFNVTAWNCSETWRCSRHLETLHKRVDKFVDLQVQKWQSRSGIRKSNNIWHSYSTIKKCNSRGVTRPTATFSSWQLRMREWPSSGSCT